MPIVALSIVKSTSFQGQPEEFSNVYTYDSGADVSNDWSGIATRVADAEKTIMAVDTTFLRYHVWSIGGTPAQNVFIDAGDLSGTGAVSGTRSLYQECAVLVRFELSRSAVLKRKRFLSKWLHAGILAGTGDSLIQRGKLPLTAADKQPFLDYAETIRSGGVGSGVFLTDALGEQAGAASVFDYVEHRQFHQGRKRRTAA